MDQILLAGVFFHGRASLFSMFVCSMILVLLTEAREFRLKDTEIKFIP